MTAHREVELKRLLLGERADEKLIHALGAGVARETIQVNHVFDTADHALRRARYALRLRTEGPAAFITAKGPTRSVGRSTGSKIEAEAAIDPALADDVLAGRADPLAVLRSRLADPAYERLWRAFDRARDGQALRSTGHFENRRQVVPIRLPNGLAVELEIDQTRFPDGHVDHELEIELPNKTAVRQVERWLGPVLRQAGVRTRTSSPKVARFYASQTRARR